MWHFVGFCWGFGRSLGGLVFFELLFVGFCSDLIGFGGGFIGFLGLIERFRLTNVGLLWDYSLFVAGFSKQMFVFSWSTLKPLVFSLSRHH